MSVSSSVSVSQAVRRIPNSLLLLTGGRLLFVPAIIFAIPRSVLATAALLAVFIVLDLYDGVVARELDADDPARRALDSIVDRLSIWPVYAAVTVMGLLPMVLFALLVARDVYCACLCHSMLREKDVAIRADWLYRSLNLMLAGWVVMAPQVDSAVRVSSFACILVYSLVVAGDLHRSVRRVLQMPVSGAPMVLAAGSLRPGKTVREVSASGGPVSIPSLAHP